MTDAYRIIDQYTKNLLNEPIGKSRWEFMQELLKHTFFDDGLESILLSSGVNEQGDPDVVKGTNVVNNFALMAMTGAKGSFGNTKNMIVRLG